LSNPVNSSSHTASASDKLKSWPLYFLPHHLISRAVLAATRCQTPLAVPAMRAFAQHFGIDMREAAEEDFAGYPSFNAFFTRALKQGARPIADGDDEIASPVDGTVSQLGDIRDGRIFQAKGHDYSLEELVGGDPAQAALFDGGRFATLYLSPRDYHRIHMPLDGQLRDMIHVAGRLFSVAPHTVRVVPRLFARNERVVCLFDTAAGPMAMILVGAINVAAIETVWAGLVTPPGKGVSRWNYREDQSVSLQRGEEMGRFNMGSTVILLFNDSVEWDSALHEGSPVTMGRSIASLKG
jgi:phosphatidylserine decarboxylase